MYQLSGWSWWRSTIYSTGREACVARSMHLLNKAKERQNKTGRRLGVGGASGAVLEGKAMSTVMDDMCVCANLYKYHNKKHDVAAPAAKRRKWAPGVGVQGFWVFVLFFFCLCCYFIILLCLGGWWVFKTGVKALPSPAPHCNLATAQHLCSTLVSFVNPGLVGVGLEKENRGRSDRCVHKISSHELFWMIIVNHQFNISMRW